MKRVSKITEQLWRKVKAADKTCKDDAPTAKKFGICYKRKVGDAGYKKFAFMW